MRLRVSYYEPLLHIPDGLKHLIRSHNTHSLKKALPLLLTHYAGGVLCGIGLGLLLSKLIYYRLVGFEWVNIAGLAFCLVGNLVTLRAQKRKRTERAEGRTSKSLT